MRELKYPPSSVFIAESATKSGVLRGMPTCPTRSADCTAPSRCTRPTWVRAVRSASPKLAAISRAVPDQEPNSRSNSVLKLVGLNIASRNQERICRCHKLLRIARDIPRLCISPMECSVPIFHGRTDAREKPCFEKIISARNPASDFACRIPARRKSRTRSSSSSGKVAFCAISASKFTARSRYLLKHTNVYRNRIPTRHSRKRTSDKIDLIGNLRGRPVGGSLRQQICNGRSEALTMPRIECGAATNIKRE